MNSETEASITSRHKKTNYTNDEKRRITALSLFITSNAEIVRRMNAADYTRQFTVRGIQNCIRRTKARQYFISGLRKKTGPAVPDHILTALHKFIEDSRGQSTAEELQQEIMDHCNYFMSLGVVRSARIFLGFDAFTIQYCQLIHERNKRKRMMFCKFMLENPQLLTRFVFTDESMIQLGGFRRKIYRHKLNTNKFYRLRPKAKYPYKVMIWAGVSWNGATTVVLNQKIPKSWTALQRRRRKQQALPAPPPIDPLRKSKQLVNSVVYNKVLEKSYIPFVNQYYNNDAILIADSARIHTSKVAMEFITENNIDYDPNFWPPESPDLNVIECVWNELKTYVMNKRRPNNVADLHEAIMYFWRERMTVPKCRKYIAHFWSAIVEVVENEGEPTLG